MRARKKLVKTEQEEVKKSEVSVEVNRISDPDSNEYYEDLKVDIHSLDHLWAIQPQLYMKWAERHAKAIAERDRLKERLELVKAEVSADVRRNPADYSIEKLTEAAVHAAVISDEKVRKVSEQLIRAAEVVNILAGAKEGMNHKKSALETLAKLWLGSYYSEPDIPQEAKEVSSSKTREAQKVALNERMKGN